MSISLATSFLLYTGTDSLYFIVRTIFLLTPKLHDFLLIMHKAAAVITVSLLEWKVRRWKSCLEVACIDMRNGSKLKGFLWY